MSARPARRSRKRNNTPMRRSTGSNGRKVSAAATSAGRRWSGRSNRGGRPRRDRPELLWPVDPDWQDVRRCPLTGHRRTRQDSTRMTLSGQKITWPACGALTHPGRSYPYRHPLNTYCSRLACEYLAGHWVTSVLTFPSERTAK